MKELIITGSKQEVPLEDFYILENGEKLNFKFLVSGEIEYAINPDIDDNYQACIIDDGYNHNIYWLSDFMKFDHKTTFVSKNFEGVASDTNTSGIAIRLSDCNDLAAIYRVY